MRHHLPVCAFCCASCIETGFNDPDSEAVAPVVAEEHFTQAPASGVDVLFVIDSTGSMGEEQAAIAAAASTFVDSLADVGLDWQIGVATMDLAGNGELRGRPWILTPATEGAGEILAATMLVGTESPPPAAGLDAAVLALSTPANVGFRRPDAALHVVFVSDGDDDSGEVIEGDPVDGFLGVLDEQITRTARPATASALVDDGSGACDAPEYDALPGPRFVEVATRSGGVVASICGGDFAGVAGALASVGAIGATVFPLQADPDEDAVTVTVQGERVADGWVVDHAVPALVFAAPPPLGAEIVVRYEIAG